MKHDVSVAVSAVPEMLARAAAAVEAVLPGVRPMPFGHVGDGNIHYNLLPPLGCPPDSFSAAGVGLTRAVHDVVTALGGSVSAEHGLGQVRQLVSRPLAAPKALWAMEQALRSSACAAVLAWTEAADTHALRRLKLAAIEGGCIGFLFRSLRHRPRPSPATVRLALRSEGAALVVDLVKVQGGRAATLRLSPN